HGVDAARAAMFEDMPHNLEAPHALGMTTVLVRSDANEDHPIQKAMRAWAAPPPHVHHMTYDLAEFLEGIGAGPVAADGGHAHGLHPDVLGSKIGTRGLPTTGRRGV